MGSSGTSDVSVPVIGVARSDWSMDQLVARARDAVEKNADFDETVFARLAEHAALRSG